MGKLLERDYYEPYDTEEDITKKVKVGVPYFNGRLNPTTFADWLSAIDEPFFFIEEERANRPSLSLCKNPVIDRISKNSGSREELKMVQHRILLRDSLEEIRGSASGGNMLLGGDPAYGVKSSKRSSVQCSTIRENENGRKDSKSYPTY
ncbi:hypothetical protein AgCh_006719 [Apium graveolens]